MGDIPGLGRMRRAWRTLFSRRARLIARVQAVKAARRASPARHVDQPRLSLVLLSFNHRDNVAAIADGLQRTIAEELIVVDDGSIDGADRAWQQRLTRPNDFLIRANDIHESRAYNRAIDLSRGEFVCILQDDDIPPDSGDWVTQALDLFDRYPRLAVLGGHQGWAFDLSTPSTQVVRRDVVGYREGKWTYARDIPLRDPVSGLPFMFAQGVSVGPIFYRREVFQSLGGFSLAYSRAGENAMFADHELSLRAWLAGYEVAVYGPAPFQRHVGGQGTFMFAPELRERQLAFAWRAMQQQYAACCGLIDAAVAEANRRLTANEPTAAVSVR